MEKSVVFTGTKQSKLVKWKVKSGGCFSAGTVLCLYLPDGESVLQKMKAAEVGTVTEICAKENDTVSPGGMIMRMKGCSHPVVMKDMCAECGADLREDYGFAGDLKSSTSASVAMVHSVPELIVSEQQAVELGKEDEERLLKSRKLVLLVDLDETVLHTTNDNIPDNLKDVYHFQLWHGPNLLWYHTKFRPNTEKFLQKISQMFELHIVTFGTRMYAHTMARYLDPEGKYFSHRILSRDECFDARSKTANLKSLFPCGDAMVCIIDDRDEVWNLAPNMIRVKPYIFFDGTADINAPPGMDKPGKGDLPDNNAKPKRNVKIIRVPKSKAEEVKTAARHSDMEGSEVQGKTESKEKAEQQPESVEKIDSVGGEGEKNTDLAESMEMDKGDCIMDLIDTESVEYQHKIAEQKKAATECTSSTEQSVAEQKKTEQSVQDETVSESNTVQNTVTASDNDKGDQQDGEKGDQESTAKKDDVQPANGEKQVGQDEQQMEIEPDEQGKPGEQDKQVEQGKQDEQGAKPSQVQDDSKSEEKEEVKDKDEVESQMRNVTFEEKSQESVTGSNENSNASAEADYEELIEWEDTDDYLMYLEDILTRIHTVYFNMHDKQTGKSNTTKDDTPNLKKIIPYVKRKVLQGVNVVFSSVVPMNQPLQHSRAYMVARSLGANVQTEIISDGGDVSDRTTHLVAAKLGTQKVRAAIKQKGLHIVRPDWLWTCHDRWERVEESLFLLDEKHQYADARDSPDLSLVKEKLKRKADDSEPDTTTSGDSLAGRKLFKKAKTESEAADSQVSSSSSCDLSEKKKQDEDEMDTVESSSQQSGVTVSDNQEPSTSGISTNNVIRERRFSETINPLYSFSSKDFEDMDKEVDEMLSSDSSSDDETKNNDDDDSNQPKSSSKKVKFVVENEERDGDSSDSEKAECELRRRVLSGRKDSSSEDSMSADFPKGWKRKLSPKRSSNEDNSHLLEIEDPGEAKIALLNLAQASPHWLFDESSNSQDDSDDDSIGSADDMAAAVEKELFK